MPRSRLGRVRLDVAEDDADAREQDQIERDRDGRVADVRVLEAERDHAADRREDVEAEHGAALVDAERDEPMRQMIAAAVERAPAGQPSGDADERRIEDRDEQDEQRDRRDRHDADSQPGAASSAAPPRNDPRNRLPLSPMKIDAGRTL